MSASVNPPQWAESVLRLVLGPGEAETVFGDLLEQYRETVYPGRGRSGAAIWLARQVGGFVWRASWVWAVLMAAVMAGRGVFDAFWPPADSNWGPRSAFTTYAMAALFLGAGAWAARRTGRVLSGALAAMAAHVIGTVFGVAYQTAFFYAIIQPDPEKLRLFRLTGDWDEVLFLPLLLIPAVLALGTLGGLLGRFLTPATRPPIVTEAPPA